MGWKQTGLRTTVCFFHGSDPNFRENDTKLLSAPSGSCCLLWHPVATSQAMSINFYCMCAQNVGIAYHVMNCAGHEKKFKTVRSKNVKKVATLLKKGRRQGETGYVYLYLNFLAKCKGTSSERL